MIAGWAQQFPVSSIFWNDGNLMWKLNFQSIKYKRAQNQIEELISIKKMTSRALKNNNEKCDVQFSPQVLGLQRSVLHECVKCHMFWVKIWMIYTKIKCLWLRKERKKGISWKKCRAEDEFE